MGIEGEGEVGKMKKQLLLLRKRWRGCFNAQWREKLVRGRKGNQNTGSRSLELLRSLEMRGRRESKQQAEKEVELGRLLKPPRLSGRRKETQEKMAREKLRGSARGVWGHELQNYNWSSGLQ